MTVTCGSPVSADGGGGGGTGAGGRRVLAAKTDSVSNVNNNNTNILNNNNNNNNHNINNNNNHSNSIIANGGVTPPSSITGKASVLSVRRVLFGPPADPAETRAWLDRQLCAAAAADSRSWNFDFVNERPLRDSPTDRYAWERVCPPTPPTDDDDQQQQEDQATAADPLAEQQRRDGKQRQSKVTGKNRCPTLVRAFVFFFFLLF